MSRKSGRRTGGKRKPTGTPGGRNKAVRLKTAKGRTTSSTRWLSRQLNDPYVHEAERQGFRSRAAFKLIELDDRFRFLTAGARIVDLGAAPGGWTQVAVERVKATPGANNVIAIDILPMDPVPGAQILNLDFLDPNAPELLKAALDGPADVVLSDMAAQTTGHKATDHIRIMGLVEAALEFACEVLAPDGVFIAKVFQGGAESQLLGEMKRYFKSVKHAKPPASRSGSSEIYVVANGFRGHDNR